MPPATTNAYYLTVEEIPAPSLPNHPNEIPVQWFEIKGFNAGGTSGGGSGVGKVTFEPVRVNIAHYPESNAALNLKMASGRHLRSAAILLYKGNQSDTKILLEDVLVKSVATGFENNKPSDTIELTYTRIKWIINGNTSGWDIQKNQSI